MNRADHVAIERALRGRPVKLYPEDHEELARIARENGKTVQWLTKTAKCSGTVAKQLLAGAERHGAHK